MTMNLKFPEARLIVFAKAPVPHQVKTRLIPHLGVEGATQLHQQLAWQSISTAAAAQLCPVQLWCAPAIEHPFFQSCQDHFAVTLHQQQGDDLGARMAEAFKETLQDCRYAVIIGTDCPALTRHDLDQALTALREGYDAVIGPAEDGGYVLLGLRLFNASLFENIGWGSAEVLRITRERLAQLHWRCHELTTQWDVDRPEDIERLRQSGILRDMPDSSPIITRTSINGK